MHFDPCSRVLVDNMRKRKGNRKLPGRSRKRGRRRDSGVGAGGDSEDDGDEEYVAGEDEDEYDEEEEEEESDDDDEDEEEFQFCDSSSGDAGSSDEEEEADFDGDDEDDDDDEVKDSVQVSRSRRWRSAGNSRSHATKSRASDRLRKEDVQDPLVEVSRLKPPKVASCSKRSVRKPRVWDHGIEDGEDEEAQNDFEDSPRSKRKRAAAVPQRTAGKFRVSDDEYDEDEEDSKRKKRIGIRFRKNVDEDYEEDLEEEYDDDEDFILDELDEDDGSLISPKKNVNGTKRRKSTSSKQKNAGKRRKLRLEDEDYDDFCVENDHSGDTKREEKKKNKEAENNNTKRSLTSRRTRKKSPALDSETSDFDYVTSDDDFEVKDWNMLDKQRNRIRNGRTDPAERARRRMSSFIGSDESDTSSSDSNFEISEEELRDLGIGGVLNRPQPKRVFAEKKGEEKGKEKVSDEATKQVCGICLSEEQMTTVQGILNCCAHYFCFACIMEWSKVESRCPLCKRRFGMITKSSRSYPGFGLRKSLIKVEKRDQVYQPSEQEIHRFLDPYENVVCMECQQGGDDSVMLLCDICDSSAHTYCVGLGREVPEGNWYCECCRFVADISSNVTNRASDDGPSNGTFQNHGMEREENERGEVSATPTTQQPIPSTGQPSDREFDLNVSPRPEEDYGTAQASGGVAATVSGRRAIRQHIRLRFFSTRLSQTSAANDLPQHNAESENINPGAAVQGEQCLHGSVSQPNGRSFFQSNSILAPCLESSFRSEEGAKPRVHSIVKRHLEDLSMGSQLEHSTFKKIARRSTHTILAACGIKHKKKLVVGSFRPPSSCSHISEDLSPFLVQACCSSCFTSFVANVVSDVLCKASQR